MNPRPLSKLVPSSGLCGCFSADGKQILAVAWEPYQEIFQGVVTCLHSDFRIGGLQPGETKVVRGKIYLTDANVERLVRRYERDFPEQVKPQAKPLHRTVELRIGEGAQVQLHDGSQAKVKLLEVQETRDSVRAALREARVTIEINGRRMTLVSGNYRLPITAEGVQVDCIATKGLYQNHDPWEDSWGLDKDARLRLWPAGSSWMPPGEFGYPIKQRWFASATQFSNEPSHVDGGDAPTGRKIYYHNGLDIGGCEGLAEVVAATDGTVVSAGKEVLPGYGDSPVAPRYDVVYVRDARDWY